MSCSPQLVVPILSFPYYYYFQATFGVSRNSIDAMVSSSNDFASWVEDQLNMPMSSHRAFFRERMNPKFEYPYHSGAVGPRPCELHSRWRRYAISSRDQLSNRKTNWFKHLTIEFVSGVGYVWKVDGFARTVTQTHPETMDGSSQLELNKRYRINHTNGNTWKTDCVGENAAYHMAFIMYISHIIKTGMH